MEFNLKKNILRPIIPLLGGGLSMETFLFEKDKKKYIVRKCVTKENLRRYEFISKKLSSKQVIPRKIKREGNYLVYEYLHGRDLRQKETLDIFKQVGIVCAKINSIGIAKSKNYNLLWNKQLKELEKGKYKQFTIKELKEKKKRRPNERHDKRRIKSVITLDEKNKVAKIVKRLIKITKPSVSLDASDASPANFRLSRGVVYFVDIGGIKKTIKGIGLAKVLLGWTKTEKQKKAVLEGYMSITKKKISKEYLNLISLYYIIQSLHDRAKIGRDYKKQLTLLHALLKTY